VRPRHLLLAAALLAVALLSWRTTDEEGEAIVEAVRPAARPARTASTPPAAGPSGQRPAFQADTGADLFPAQSFRPPPPPPQKPLPPPPPMAPPLPFQFVGQWTENGQDTVFLGQGDKVLAVRQGARLEGGWRLDELKPGSLLFTYEPLNQQQTLRTAP
jgi:hypothetical protein